MSNNSNTNSNYKRPRKQTPSPSPSPEHDSSSSSTLVFHSLSRSWLQAAKRARTHPEEAQYGCTSSARAPLKLNPNPNTNTNTNGNVTNGGNTYGTGGYQQSSSVSSPLAMACRYGAPPDTVDAILQADVTMVRRLIPNRGTPLHEAIMAFPIAIDNSGNGGNSSISSNGSGNSYSSNGNNNGNGNQPEEDDEGLYSSYVRVIRLLLHADEQLPLPIPTEDGNSNYNECDTSTEHEHEPPRTLQQLHNQMHRATLVQDVDGNVPLHLLIRQAFYNYLATIHQHSSSSASASASASANANASANSSSTTTTTAPHPLSLIIQDVIQSCPQACAMPDFTEFELTPLVLVLKASVFANEQRSMRMGVGNGNTDTDIDVMGMDNGMDIIEVGTGIIRPNPNNADADTDADIASDYNYNTELELRIFEVCKIMLEQNPYAASFVASKSKHTAVHSAVYHGRCCDTIRLLLKADLTYRKQQKERILQRIRIRKRKIDSEVTLTNNTPCATTAAKCSIHEEADAVPPSAAMRGNRFGETPLHFAAMRGECTKTIELLSQEAPWAVLKRDVKFGMTPLHWLSVRFVDIIYEQFGDRIFQWNEEEDNDGNDLGDGDGDSDCGVYGHSIDVLDAHVELSSLCATTATATALIPTTSSDIPTAADTASKLSSSSSTNDAQILFDLEYHRRTGAIDPPVDYMRMRHILPDHLQIEGILMKRVSKVLTKVRERHRELMADVNRRAMGHGHGHGSDSDSESEEKVASVEDDKKMDASPNEQVCPYSGIESKSECPHKEYDQDLTNPPTSVSYLDQCPHMRRQEKQSRDVNVNDGQVKSAKCPNEARNEACNEHVMLSRNHALVQKDASKIDGEKCPFRCPFVLNSYPIDPGLIGAKKEAVREEQVISLFWAKVTSLLHAATVARATNQNDDPANLPASLIDDENVFMLHSACSAPSPLAIVRLCLSLYPEQLLSRDQDGKLPLHHAACRKWDIREFRERNDDKLIDMPNLIQNESSKALVLVLNSSPAEAARTFDNKGRLPFHYAIDSAVRAVVDYSFTKRKFSKRGSESEEDTDDALFTVVKDLRAMIRVSPETMEKKDGRTGLYPFMQVSAVAAALLARHDTKVRSTKITLSLTYALLLENPSLVSVGLSNIIHL